MMISSETGHVRASAHCGLECAHRRRSRGPARPRPGRRGARPRDVLGKSQHNGGGVEGPSSWVRRTAAGHPQGPRGPAGPPRGVRRITAGRSQDYRGASAGGLWSACSIPAGRPQILKTQPPRKPAVMTTPVSMEAMKKLAEERALLTYTSSPAPPLLLSCTSTRLGSRAAGVASGSPWRTGSLSWVRVGPLGLCKFFPPRILASTGFLSLWDLASTGFLIGFSVFCTDYGFLVFCRFPEYWFSYRWFFL